MDIESLKGKLVAIVGFGEKEGVATTEYLLRHGISPTLFDSKPWDAWPEERKELIRSWGVNIIFGPDYLKELAGFDVVFRNPAVPRLTPELVALEQNGAVITSQTNWFMEHCPAPVIGITGTKGKGTTTSLIYQALQLQRQETKSVGQVFLTGNIGKIQPFEFLDELTPRDTVVYEMSSFQLQDLQVSPHIAVVLMVTSEHLDHHNSLEEYHLAKAQIAATQKEGDVVIINKDYPASVFVGERGQGLKQYISTKGAGNADCFVQDGFIMLGKFEVCKTEELQLRGSHNWENVCAAVLASHHAGVSLEVIRTAVTQFKGLEHRLELVREIKGVRYYNDSFSTTPETAIAAMQAFTEPKIVILGGSSKNSDFTELGKVVNQQANIKTIIAIGQEAETILASIEQAGGTNAKIVTGLTTMAEIVDQANANAEAGDVVLLSPACASFGMFANYKDRGNQFKQAVALLHEN